MYVLVVIKIQRQSLYNIMARDNGYTQLISNCTTDNKTIIDHIYSNIADTVNSAVLETYFSDHKAIWTSCKTGQQACEINYILRQLIILEEILQAQGDEQNEDLYLDNKKRVDIEISVCGYHTPHTIYT